jgi:hypothetical protein
MARRKQGINDEPSKVVTRPEFDFGKLRPEFDFSKLDEPIPSLIFLDEDEQKALRIMVEIVKTAYNLIDNTGEMDGSLIGEQGSIFVAPEKEIVELNRLFDKAEELCEDDADPDFTMGPSSKLGFILRRLGIKDV